MKWFKRNRWQRFKVGDYVLASDEQKYIHIYNKYFKGGKKEVVRVEETERLSYCEQFVYIKWRGEEQGFYNRALKLAR